MDISIALPEKFGLLFEPHRYKVIRGGRCGGKSWACVIALILRAMQGTERIVCAREFQKSLAQSVHQLICDQIRGMGVSHLFEIQRDKITCIQTGSVFSFVGLSNETVDGVKSLEGCTICFVEEAQSVSERSWATLIPTLRAEGSEFWIIFNPRSAQDPTYVRFVTNAGSLHDCVSIEVNYPDNPFVPQVSLDDISALKASDYDAYLHIYRGQPLRHSDAAVFASKLQSYAFEPVPELWGTPYFGLDFGFARDPLVLTKSWIYERVLYVEYCVHHIGLEIEQTPAWMDAVPGSRDAIIRADCARPEMINYLKRNGFPKCIPSAKWKGCIEDGCDHMRSFDAIVIHSRAKEGLQQMTLYSYKINPATNEVLSECADRYADTPDTLRYSLEPFILGHKKRISERNADQPSVPTMGRYGGVDPNAWLM